MHDTAIVVQGPVSHHTDAIVAAYAKLDAEVIVSTYKNSPIPAEFDGYDNVHVVMSDPPRIAGVYNRNCQRWTTHAGLSKARELNLTYCLKTRTDHFFKNKSLLHALKDALKQYPLRSSNQLERIVVPNGGTTLNQQWGRFHVSDHWLFGTTTDLLDYFSVDNPYWDAGREFNLPVLTSPEPEFCQLWMALKGLLHYDTCSALLRDRFVVVDNPTLLYDVVKEPGIDINAHRTDWNKWCDPLTVHSNVWSKFLDDRPYTVQEEAEMNTRQQMPT